MGPRVAKEQLEDIVEEAQRLEDAEREELTRGEVREVLRDLDISPDKLDEAERLALLRRAQAKKRRKLGLLAAGGLALALAVGGAVYVSSRATADRLAQTTVAQHAVTANGETSPFSRATSPEVKLDVAIAGAPRGERLELTCDWIDPGGVKVHESRWTTKTVDRDPWPTHCRYPLGPAAPTGTWTVTAKQGERVLSTGRFEVK
jgi:hypothetical protein